MIIISGCSWSCGEWDADHNADIKIPTLQHGGLGQYITESGREVLNLGIPGGTNLSAAKRVLTWIERNPQANIEQIFMFQTEWNRDHRMIFEDDFRVIEDAHTIPGRWVARYYSRLCEIAQLAGCHVNLIGGVSDTIWLDNFEGDYPGVRIACQSMTNLLINNNHRIDNPVLSWFNRHSPPLIKRIRSHLTTEQIPELLAMIDMGFERENLVFQHPEYFWPDGNHPNREAHLVLYDYLIKNNYV